MKKIILLLSILLITNSYSLEITSETIEQFYNAYYRGATVHSVDTTRNGDVVLINDRKTFNFGDEFMTSIIEKAVTDYYEGGILKMTIKYYIDDQGYGFRDSLITSITRIQDDGIHKSSIDFRDDETVLTESYSIISGEYDESYYKLYYYTDGNLLQRTDMRTAGSGITEHLVMTKKLYSKSGRVVGLYNYIKNDVGKYVLHDYTVVPPVGDFDIQYSATFVGSEKSGTPVYVMSKNKDEDELTVEAYTMDREYAGKYAIYNVKSTLIDFYKGK